MDTPPLEWWAVTKSVGPGRVRVHRTRPVGSRNAPENILISQVPPILPWKRMLETPFGKSLGLATGQK